MFAFNLKPRFARKYAKLIKRNRRLEAQIDHVLELLADNPRHQALGTHKVLAWDREGAFSSEITGDLRLIWRYARTELEVIDLVDIGGHEGGRKVYR